MNDFCVRLLDGRTLPQALVFVAQDERLCVNLAEHLLEAQNGGAALLNNLFYAVYSVPQCAGADGAGIGGNGSTFSAENTNTNTENGNNAGIAESANDGAESASGNACEIFRTESANTDGERTTTASEAFGKGSTNADAELAATASGAFGVESASGNAGGAFCIESTATTAGASIFGVFCITAGGLLMHHFPFLEKAFAKNPQLSDPRIDALRQKLGRVLQTSDLFCAMGEASVTNFLAETSGRRISCNWLYDFMEYKPQGRAAVPQDCELPPPLQFRLCTPSDGEALYPLQKSYEFEEVLPPGSEHSPYSCKKNLAASLVRRQVYAVFDDKTPVAKCGINAQGFKCRQIGGVFTATEWRGRGLARASVKRLAEMLAAQGKTPVLFVKVANEPAKRAYAHAGFAAAANYRIIYF